MNTDFRKLGKTNIEVSRICLGTLTMGPLQRNLAISEGGDLIRFAMDQGINFFDTAELYRTYGYLKAGLEGIRSKAVISSKCYAYDRAGAEKSLRNALKEIGTDYIDIFMLHEQESEHTIRGHWEAVEYFLEAKEKGYIRAVGLSTHCVDGIKGAIKHEELEVVHPMINFSGLGIINGTKEDMLQQMKLARLAGKGIFAMKVLGGGNLLKDYDKAIKFARELDEADSVAIGMQSKEEILANIQYFHEGKVDEALSKKLSRVNRSLIIEEHCTGCGKCVRRCNNGALTLKDGKATVQKNRCVTCGYCAAVCTDFCIKVI